MDHNPSFEVKGYGVPTWTQRRVEGIESFTVKPVFRFPVKPKRIKSGKCKFGSRLRQVRSRFYTELRYMGTGERGRGVT